MKQDVQIENIVSPFLYGFLILPVLVGSMFLIASYETHFNYLLSLNGVIEMIVIIILWGGLVFSWGNKGIFQLEKISYPTIFDHIRQTSVLYVMIFVALHLLVRRGYHGGIGGALGLVLITISLWGIFVNMTHIYLFRRSKREPERKEGVLLQTIKHVFDLGIYAVGIFLVFEFVLIYSYFRSGNFGFNLQLSILAGVVLAMPLLMIGFVSMGKRNLKAILQIIAVIVVILVFIVEGYFGAQERQIRNSHSDGSTYCDVEIYIPRWAPFTNSGIVCGDHGQWTANE